MTKLEFIERYAARHSISRRQAAEAVDNVFDLIQETLAAGHVVRLFGFGIFVPTDTGESQGRDPRTRQPVTIPATRRLRFRPSRKFLRILHSAYRGGVALIG